MPQRGPLLGNRQFQGPQGLALLPHTGPSPRPRPPFPPPQQLPPAAILSESQFPACSFLGCAAFTRNEGRSLTFPVIHSGDEPRGSHAGRDSSAGVLALPENGAAAASPPQAPVTPLPPQRGWQKRRSNQQRPPPKGACLPDWLR